MLVFLSVWSLSTFPYSSSPELGALFSDKMVFIKPDIEAGTIQDQADLVTPAQYLEPDTDEEPDVEEIEVCVICCAFLKIRLKFKKRLVL